MAAVPFGFSVGDFVACIEILHKAAQALKRSSGARDQFHQAVADLEGLVALLRKVEALSPTTTKPETIEAVRLCAFKCHLPLNHFLERIKTYDAHLIHSPGPRKHAVHKIVGSFWKLDWAVRVEEDVAKLKVSIGPLLTAMTVLLQIESLDHETATQKEIRQVLCLVQDVATNFERTRLVTQGHFTAIERINLIATDVGRDTTSILQRLPLLATASQLGALQNVTDNVANSISYTATREQVDKLKSQLEVSSATHRMNYADLMTTAQRQEEHGKQIDQAIKGIQFLVSLIFKTLADRAQPISRTTSSPNSSQQTRMQRRVGPQDSFNHAATPYEPSDRLTRWLLVPLHRLLLFAVMAYVLSLPKDRAQLHTCMTDAVSPTLPLENNIMFTDALDRTSRLPYEYFLDWNLLRAWLQGTFQGLPGQSRVLRGDFALFKSSEDKVGSRVPPNEWECSVFAGDCIVMSILVRPQSKRDACWRCRSVLAAENDSNAWQTWSVHRLIRLE